jgi:DNA-binding MarR family transcriptional regulator
VTDVSSAAGHVPNCPVPDAIDRLSTALRTLQRTAASRQLHEQLTTAAGVSLTQQAVRVLHAVASVDATPMADVARRAHMDLAAVSRQIRLLDEAGLVTRRLSSNHGSTVLLDVTAKGRRCAQRLDSAFRQHLVDALDGWAPDELDRFSDALDTLANGLASGVPAQPANAG